MKDTTMYMAKIDKEPFEKWKSNNGEFNGRLQFQLWVKYLSNSENFAAFHSTILEEETTRTENGTKFYRLMELDREEWRLFMKNCRKYGLFANDMVNILIKRFNGQGWCIETEIKV